jgi:hypothetical protein
MERQQGSAESPRTTHVILIGASIGQAWNLPGWPQRVNLSGFTAESIANWQFDKSEGVEEVLIRPKRRFRFTRTYLKSLIQPPPKKPDIIILKECSSYFPGDLESYKKDVDKWVQELQGTGAKVVLATVVPVTEQRAQQNPGKQESIRDYNKWVRQYSRNSGLSVLDLDLALEQSGGYLRNEFAQPDGSHLNAAAYGVLDRLLKNTICSQGNQQACP